MRNQQAGFIGKIIMVIIALLLIGGVAYLYSNGKLDSLKFWSKVTVSQEEIDSMIVTVDKYVAIANDKIQKGNAFLVNLTKELDSKKKAYDIAVATKPNDPNVVKLGELISVLKNLEEDMKKSIVYYENLLVELPEMKTRINDGEISKDAFLFYSLKKTGEMKNFENIMRDHLTKLNQY